ncbi:2898_t:CDS:2 [Diversispora eburnea]|uniref:2898_t:CDS:1 n=1 Tax=Diversispora eburnea TaxID=1213867 RepID=A0A9N9A7S2_9GLOM|nr:2898_t:CDS:2 [Diversispora eburnea]
MTAFTEEEWTKAIQELIRVVKPGGWLELMEGDLAFNPEGPTGRILMDASQLHNFSYKEKSGPIGSWAGSIGELACQDFCGILYALRPILTIQLNKKPEEFDEMVVEFGKECNENKTNFRHFRFFCQKLD